MPYWLLAQSDTFAVSSKIAENSFKTLFNEKKQPEVVYFAREEIISVYYDFLIVQTFKTLSDIKLVVFLSLFMIYQTSFYINIYIYIYIFQLV